MEKFFFEILFKDKFTYHKRNFFFGKSGFISTNFNFR